MSVIFEWRMKCKKNRTNIWDRKKQKWFSENRENEAIPEDKERGDLQDKK